MLTIAVPEAAFAELYDRLIDACPAVERMDREREHLAYRGERPALVFAHLTIVRDHRPDPVEWR